MVHYVATPLSTEHSAIVTSLNVIPNYNTFMLTSIYYIYTSTAQYAEGLVRLGFDMVPIGIMYEYPESTTGSEVQIEAFFSPSEKVPSRKPFKLA